MLNGLIVIYNKKILKRRNNNKNQTSDQNKFQKHFLKFLKDSHI